MITGFVRRLIALLVFFGCGNFLYQYGVSDINSQALWKGQAAPLNAYQQVADRLSTGALVVQAQSQPFIGGSPEISEKLALSALSQNPSSGRAATYLLNLYESEGHDVEADQVAELASKLWPAHTYTRSNLAEYWLRRDRADKLVDEWSVLLIRNRSLRKELFPLMLKMVENDDLVSLILPFAKKPPSWWNGFFGYLSGSLSLDRLDQLYRLRVASAVQPSQSEQNSYVRRLIKERRWEDAYDTWFIALTRGQMRYGGLIFDGGFESDVYNQGFGWQLSPSKNPKIKPDITYGIKGRKALQITLRKQSPINFRHVWQRLILPEGDYELSMRYRTDTLKTTKGLSWRLRCVEGGAEVLGESIPLLGSNPWSSLKVNFKVPKSCSVQMLRLEATSTYRHDHFFQGNVWFDALQISRVEPQKVVQ